MSLRRERRAEPAAMQSLQVKSVVFMALLAVSLALADSRSNLGLGGDLVIGVIGGADSVLLSTVKFCRGNVFTNTQIIFRYPDRYSTNNHAISGCKVEDLSPGNNYTASVLQGGVGYSFVTLRITAEVGDDINVRITVYGV